MAKRLTQALGVDIGTQTMKIAAVRQSRESGVGITALGLTRTPEGTVDYTGIFDPQTLGASLRSLITESRAGVRDVVFCINGQSSVVVRNLEVPRMSESDLASHMQWEIERNVPFAESETVSDYRPIDNPALAGTDNMEVVMAVSPRSAIETVLALIKAAGCRPAAIDVEPLGIARVLKTCHPNDLGSKNVCVVHIGHSTTAINMYRSVTLAFPRSVPLGSSQLTQAIAEAFGITMVEAEERKHSAGAVPEGFTAGGGGVTVQTEFQPYTPFGEPQPGGAPSVTPADRLFQAIQPHLEEFVAELRRSIDYYRSRGGEVDEIALSGGGARLKGLDQYIHRSLGFPVSFVNPFQGVDLSGVEGAETFVRDHASEFVVAVGMGLHIAYD
ncbi:MAG: type IV pilus assembly protein PilM [Thermoflavifilum sp.]|nr:type IV pilus assembly protein PilM [Thermoflavifilum sp.]MCL6514407.1 type IV pilus assembly protein PilM [Alicyclobacillus sp.]